MSTEGGQVPPYFWGMNTNATLSSADLMALEDAHGAHNYHPFRSCSTAVKAYV